MKKQDIIVIGGGFAGVAAAIAAARQGKSVLLVEKYNCLGGAAVFDLVNPFMRFWTYTADKKERIYLSRGIFTEILREMKELGGFLSESQDSGIFNEEYLKLALNRMCLKSGVTLLFQTYLTGVAVKEGRISSVTVSNVSGQTELEADCFIDATGDANLAALAKFPFRLGRDTDHLCQPMTLCFRMTNVNRALFDKERPKINPLYTKFREEGKITNPREDVLIFHTVNEDTLHFNTTRIVKLNPTDAEDVTKAEIAAREQVFEMVAFLKENFASFRDATLISTGMQIGVRESRMIIGEKVLTEEDLLTFRKEADGIAVCNYDIDIHSPDGTGTTHYYFPDGEYYTIPYGCLVPKGAKNLLVAGRCVSATHEAQASLRIMPTCCTLGEAAGIAAAVACTEKKDVFAVDVQKIRRILTENGAKVD